MIKTFTQKTQDLGSVTSIVKSIFSLVKNTSTCNLQHKDQNGQVKVMPVACDSSSYCRTKKRARHTGQTRVDPAVWEQNFQEAHGRLELWLWLCILLIGCTWLFLLLLFIDLILRQSQSLVPHSTVDVSKVMCCTMILCLHIRFKGCWNELFLKMRYKST